jgi:membrane associated rhomboid family serine protease
MSPTMNEPTGPFTIAIIALTALVSAAGFASPPLVERYLFEPSAILRRGQYERLVTSGFLHANWAHLIVNMFSLYSFGGAIEELFGASTLLAIYFASILGGNLLSLMLHRGGEYRALGASGGVCGVIFASIFLVPGSSVYMFPVPFPIPSPVFAVLFIAISFFGIRSRRGNIGHDAHLGGAVIGLVVTTLLHPAILKKSLPLWMIVMGISIALFVYLAAGSRSRPPRPRIARTDRGEGGGAPW